MDPRSGFSRWLALAIAYWSFNMTLAYSQASYYPGFNYSDEEKAEMEAIAKNVSGGAFFVWAGICAVLFIAMAGVLMWGQMTWLTHATGNQDSSKTSARLFFVSFGVALLAAFTIALPLAMTAAAGLVSRFSDDSELPDAAMTARIAHRTWWQLMRLGIVMVLGIVGVMIFAPDDSRFFVVLRVAAPLLSAAVSVGSLVWFVSRRRAMK